MMVADILSENSEAAAVQVEQRERHNFFLHLKQTCQILKVIYDVECVTCECSGAT